VRFRKFGFRTRIFASDLEIHPGKKQTPNQNGMSFGELRCAIASIKLFTQLVVIDHVDFFAAISLRAQAKIDTELE
jgi:hypothetical protein